MSALERVDWLDPRAIALRTAMDEESGALYADASALMPREDRVRFARVLAVDPDDVVVTFLVLADDGTAVGHAGLKRLRGDLADAFEVKKVFVDPAHRGRGLSRALMLALEPVARDAGAQRLVLQTGDRQPVAVGLYRSLGYEPVPAFGGYEIFAASLFFGKTL